MTTEKILSSYTIAQLKREISKTNIKGYSKMKRAELHAIIMKNKERFSHLKEQEKKKAKAKPKAKPPTNKPKPAPKPKPKPAPKPKPKTPTPKPKTPPSKLDELKKKFNSLPAKSTKIYKEQIKKKNFKLLGQEVSEEEWYNAIVGLLEGLAEDKKKSEAEKVKKKAEKEAKKEAIAKKKTAGAPSYTFQAASAVPLKAGDYVPKPAKIPADFDKERGGEGGFFGGGRYSNFTFGITYSFNFTDFAVPNPNKIPGDKFYGTDSYYFGRPVLPPPPGAKLSQPQPKYHVENTGTARDTVLGPYDVPFKFTDYMKKEGMIYLGMAEMPTYEFYKAFAGNAPNEYNKDYKGAKQVQFFKRKNFEGNNKPQLLVWIQNGEYIKTRVAQFQYFRTDFNRGKYLTLQNVNSSPKLAEFKSWLSTLK
jgi:outer membrane biosynthesis protein TonB